MTNLDLNDDDVSLLVHSLGISSELGFRVIPTKKHPIVGPAQRRTSRFSLAKDASGTVDHGITVVRAVRRQRLAPCSRCQVRAQERVASGHTRCKKKSLDG